MSSTAIHLLPKINVSLFYTKIPEHNLREGSAGVCYNADNSEDVLRMCVHSALFCFVVVYYVTFGFIGVADITTQLLPTEKFSWIISIPFCLGFFSLSFLKRKNSTFISFISIVKYARNRLVSSNNNKMQDSWY